MTRSPRRRSTVAARLVGGVLEVSIPASMSAAQEERWVQEMLARARRRRRSDQVDLPSRAAQLAAAHGLPEPTSIRWVDNQVHRWGSCSTGDGSVRISSRAAGFPPWVLDYLIVHELAHLAEANHSPRFWALVERYPLTERARGYLMAKAEEA